MYIFTRLYSSTDALMNTLTTFTFLPTWGKGQSSVFLTHLLCFNSMIYKPCCWGNASVQFLCNSSGQCFQTVLKLSSSSDFAARRSHIPISVNLLLVVLFVKEDKPKCARQHHGNRITRNRSVKSLADLSVLTIITQFLEWFVV